MALRKKIDSNETSLSYAVEASLGVLPETPVWVPLEPNEYDDFGGELTLLSRQPINAGRQRKKGVITDLDASGGFNQDFTQTNFQDMLQGVMFADFREKPTALVTAVTATGYTVGDEAPFAAGMVLYASGFADPANNGRKVVTGTDDNEVEVTGLAVAAGPLTGAQIAMVGLVSAAGDLSIDASGSLPSLTSAALDFTTYGLVPGEWVFIGGDGAGNSFNTAVNNGFKRIRSVSEGEIIFDRSDAPMVTETSDTETIHIYFGRVLKNELGALVKRRSYHIERQMGAPDTDLPAAVQSGYLVGAVPNEFTLNIEQADKITADISFVATNNLQRTSAQGVFAGTRLPLVESDAFNTSSDFAMIRLAVAEPGNESEAPLFEYLTDLTFTINNNVSPNKAVAVLGAFDVTAGIFEVSGEVSAYFTTIEAVQAVRSNADCSLFVAVAKANAGWIFDMPLIGLGNARAEVELNEPIYLPLDMNAATAAKLNPDTDYTAMWVFFDYLPSLAMPQE